MGIKTWDGSAYKDIADLGAPGAPATAAFVWDGAAYVKVWPEGRLFQDDFNRPDGNLNTDPHWVIHHSDSGLDYIIENQKLTCDLSGDNVGLSDVIVWDAGSTMTGDQFAHVEIPNSTTVSTDGPGLVLGSNVGATNRVLACETNQDGGWRIYTVTPGAGTSDAVVLASGPEAIGVSGTVGLKKVGNTATMYIDGVEIGSYTGALPTGRHVGVKPVSSYGYADNWQGGDFSQAPAYMHP